VLNEYHLAAEEEATSLETEASALFEQGNESNQVSDNFVLAAVLFASVLFFAGLAGTFDSLRAQAFLLILGALMLVIGTVIVVTLPQDVGF
jgi:hypothetical protein